DWDYQQEDMVAMMQEAGTILSLTKAGAAGGVLFGGESHNGDVYSGNQNYLDLTGQLFAMLAPHFDATVDTPSVTSPTKTTLDLFGQSLPVPALQAAATSGSGRLDVQLINANPTPMQIQVVVPTA